MECEKKRQGDKHTYKCVYDCSDAPEGHIREGKRDLLFAKVDFILFISFFSLISYFNIKTLIKIFKNFII